MSEMRTYSLRAARLSLAVAIVVAALATLAALSPVARAGVVTHAYKPAVRTPGLSAAERRAISVKSITATADDSVGLVVSVQLQGNIERSFGRGGLVNGLLALALVPKTAGGTPAGLIDQGGGLTRTGFPLLGARGRKLAGRGSVDLIGAERVTRMLTGARVQVIRAANKLIFYVANRNVGRLAGVRLEVFANSPIGSGPVPAPARLAAWRRVLHAKPTFSATLSLDPSRLSGDDMDQLRGDLTHVRSTVIAPELSRQQRARAQLRTSIRGAGLRKQTRASRAQKLMLANAFRATTGGIAHLRSEIAALGGLTAQLNTLARSWVPSVQAVQTDPGLSQYLALRPSLAMSPIQAPGLPVIDVDDSVRYQQFTGVGAAMTDSSAWLLDYELPADRRLALMQALFGNLGLPNALGVPAIHLNFLRVAIGSSGAMTVGAPYSYDDMPPGQTDSDLSNFSITHDTSYLIPTLQQALAVNPGLEILANPWSPPAWMKNNDSLDNLGGNGTLLPSAFGPLANYIVKFIKAYERQGITIDDVTPQNEPSSGRSGTPYPGMTLPAADEDRFISQYLNPALRAAGLDTKVYATDHNWDLQAYANTVATGASAGDLAGIAWHCYFGTPAVMSQMQQSSPSLDQIVDECSPELRSFGTPEFLISSLRNWARIVSVWSVALDPGGGPIQAANDCPGCAGPVTINEQTQAVTFRPEYYQLGQVSAFVQPGAQRIASTSFVGYGQNPSGVETITPGLDDVAFVNPDGSKVLIAFNNSRAPISFDVTSDARNFTYTIPARAMTTFTWR
jgi:glucosylceramidase